MRFFLSIATIVALVLASAYGNKVVRLTADNFDSKIQTGVWFVKFYAPWCTHCKRLAPIWEELSLEEGRIAHVNVAEVDCTAEDSKNKCSEAKIRGYPTLMLFSNGKESEKFSGQRTIQGFKEFLERAAPAGGQEDL